MYKLGESLCVIKSLKVGVINSCKLMLYRNCFITLKVILTVFRKNRNIMEPFLFSNKKSRERDGLTKSVLGPPRNDPVRETSFKNLIG